MNLYINEVFPVLFLLRNPSTHLFIYQNFRMAMTSEVQSQISKSNTVGVGGNLAVTDNVGGGAASALFRHQFSSVSSVEFMASTGLRSLIGMQASR